MIHRKKNSYGQSREIYQGLHKPKACEFMETYPHMFMGVMRTEMIEDFKNHMKGE